MKRSVRRSPRSSLSPSPVDSGSPLGSPLRAHRNIISDLKKNINSSLKNITKLSIPGIKLGRNMNEEKSIGDAVSVFDSSDKVENTDNIDCQDLCGNIKLPITIPDGDLPLQHSELNAKKEDSKLQHFSYNENPESNPNTDDCSGSVTNEGNVSYLTELTKDIDTENSSTTDATMQTSQNVDKDESQSSKITKIIFPATNNSKTQQIAEILEQDLRQKFVDRKCYTRIIFL